MITTSAWLLLSAGCSTSGVGSGRLVTDGTPEPGSVLFLWHASPDVTRGTIRAVLPDGTEFAGDFLQISSATITQDLRPYWTAWGSPWYGWNGVGVYDDTGFVRHYSGRVIAQLHGPDEQRMRCHFTLARPEDGPRSGGVGECEMSNGDRIDYAELRGE